MTRYGKVMVLVLAASAYAAGVFVVSWRNPPFESLNHEEKYQRIIAERDAAIAEAVEAGDFRCCISPPCTMCYMEANQWNNGKAGTCACDDLIAEGREPCPQCKRGLCESGGKGTCGTSFE